MLASLPCEEKRPFGFQVWTIREKLVADFAGTLNEMAAMGYTEVEMCSPLGYSSSGFEPLHQLSNAEMRGIIDRSGLKCTALTLIWVNCEIASITGSSGPPTWE